MQLLYVLPEFPPDFGGGIATVYGRLLPRLAALGHRVTGVDRNPEAVAVSFASMVREVTDERGTHWEWRTPLEPSKPHWEGWYRDLASGPAALATTGDLGEELPPTLQRAPRTPDVRPAGALPSAAMPCAPWT